MKVALIFPSATDPRGPHLGMAAIAAFLRSSGVVVEPHDLDLESLLAILRPDRLEASLKRLRSLRPRGRSLPIPRDRLLRLGEGLSDRVAEALRVLRDPLDFYHANDFNAARDSIATAVAVASSASPLPVDYCLNPIRYMSRASTPAL
jgi:hypothetical protein